MALSQTIVHEDGDRVYLIAPVSPIEPTPAEIEEYAYGRSIVDEAAAGAPNEFIKWYSGHYVEADTPNGNNAMWTSKEIALKSLTPRFMPVTVMHQPETAVGVIADVALRTPEKDQVPRPKLDTALALWAHRFPEVIEEAMINYEHGTLMQSMECLAPAYDCAECGMGYLKLPKGAEQANWCEHLKSGNAARILRATTFTGTGLIFGTRGASGADPLAHLEDFKQEVAEYHQHGTAVNKPNGTRSKRKMETIEISRTEYDELKARPTASQLETAMAERDRAVSAQEESDAENVRLRTEVASKNDEIASYQEKASQTTLREERMGKLGDKFLSALGDTTKVRLQRQAGEMQEDEWSERVEELAGLVNIKPDEKGDGAPAPVGAGSPSPSGTPTFTSEEVARQQIMGIETGMSTPAKVTQNVIAGLVNRPGRTRAAK